MSHPDADTGAAPRGAQRRAGLLIAVVGVVVLLVVVAVVALRDEPRRARLGAGPDATPGADEREAAAGALVERLEDALVAGDPDDVESLAAPGDAAARAELRALAGNVRRLGIESLDLRYVDESERTLGSQERARYGAGAWVADVQLTWRMRGVHPAPSTLEVPVVAGWSGDRAVFGTARLGGGDDRVPLWLLERLERRHAGRVTVLAADGSDVDRLVRQGRRAVTTVGRTLPRWRGPLVVEAPADAEQFRAASGLDDGAADAIAAVTTSTDGSTLPGAPVHVYLNPAVFDPLGPRGQQIVLSHEAAHVALGAATTQAPLWLSEGVADYVALTGTAIPDSVLAAQVLRLVREDGPPEQLPGSAEFDGTDDDIGAWYEAAWLAARLVAERYGEGALLDLYRVADARGSAEEAFERVLGTTEERFLRDWRRYLADLADLADPVG